MMRECFLAGRKRETQKSEVVRRGLESVSPQEDLRENRENFGRDRLESADLHIGPKRDERNWETVSW